MKIQQFLISKNACDPALLWATGKTWDEIYTTCDRGDWLCWLFFRSVDMKDEKNLRLLTLVKGLQANQVRHLMKDERSLAAVDAAIAYGRGEIDIVGLNAASRAAAHAAYAAAHAAYAAAHAAYAYAAASVAYAYAAEYAPNATAAHANAAHANAAHAAANAEYACTADYAAAATYAHADYAAAAGLNSLKVSAGIFREHISADLFPFKD